MGDPHDQLPASADQPTRVLRDAAVDVGAPTIPGYEILEEVHRGGQGVVYRAMQLGTKRIVALKVLLEGALASELTRRRFEREIELAASLRHPNIVTILDSGVAEGRMFFAMEFLDGYRLDEYLREHRPSLEDTLGLFRQVGEAVNFAHQRGVIHRDLKPSNIMVDADGRPHILDFGLAKATDPIRGADPQQSTVAAVSLAGQVVGTIAYMSPEQAAGHENVDVRTDVYSLGVMLYAALFGGLPYRTEGPLHEVLSRVIHDDPTPPAAMRSQSRFGRQVDDELETITLKALEKEPDRRYQSAGELTRDLERYAVGDPIEAKRASGLYLMRKYLRRYRIQAVAGAAILVLMLAFLVAFAIQARTERQLRFEARQQADLADEARRTAIDAREREREAREAAEAAAAEARRLATERQRALTRATIQRGQLALLSGDVAEARNSLWQAAIDAPDSPQARWALRRYYLESGDVRAALLYWRSYGPVAISPNGRWFAWCESPAGITVARCADLDALTLDDPQWIPTSGPILALDISDGGWLGAAGVDWWATWTMQSTRAELARFECRREPVQAMRIIPGADPAVLVIDAAHAGLYDATVSSAPLQTAALAQSGAAAIAPDGDMIAIPAGETIEILTRDGPPGSTWSRSSAPAPSLFGRTPAITAAQFTSAENLAVLADGFWLTTRGQLTNLSHARLIDSRRLWRRTQRFGQPDQFLESARDGKSLLAWSTSGEFQWQFDGQRSRVSISPLGVRLVRLLNDGRRALVLDARGTLSLHEFSPSIEPDRRASGVEWVDWVASANGDEVVLLERDGDALVLRADQDDRVSRIPPPALLARGSQTADSRRLAAATPDGPVFFYADGRLWRSAADGRPEWWRPWRNRRAADVQRLLLTADGRRLILHAQSPYGDQDTIAVFDAAAPPTERPRDARRGPAVLDLDGPAVRAIATIPNGETLIIARATGALLRVPLPDPTRRPARRRLADVPPWIELDAEPRRLAVDPQGRLLAVATEHGAVQLFDLDSDALEAQQNQGRPFASLQFDSTGRMLLGRTVDGEIVVFDGPGLTVVSRWSAPTQSAAPFAAWFGDDAIVYDSDGDILELRYDPVDARIDANRSYYAEHAVQADLLVGSYASARKVLRRPECVPPHLVQGLEGELLRAGLDPDGIPIADEGPGLRFDLLLRRGHEAYAGGNYDDARAELLRASAHPTYAADALTRWRLAQCAYLLDTPNHAANEYAVLLDRMDIAPAARGRIALEQIAALVLADRLSEARDKLEYVQTADRDSPCVGQAAYTAAQMLGRYLLGQQSASQMFSSFQALRRLFGEPWLEYRDDHEFFIAELAAKAGELDEARRRYQHCVSVARDDWPSTWAQWRLAQLPAASSARAAEPNEPDSPSHKE